jgi:hypothetical protein
VVSLAVMRMARGSAGRVCGALSDVEYKLKELHKAREGIKISAAYTVDLIGHVM